MEKGVSPQIVSIPLTISITALRQVRYGERCLNIYGISGPEGRQNSFTRADSQKQLYKSCLPSNCINPFNHFHYSLKQVRYGERCLNIYGISGPEGRQNSFTRADSQKQLYKSCLPSNCINPFNHFHNSLKQERYGQRCLNIYDISGSIIMINLQHNGQITHICLCWVLWPSQPNGAMLSAVSLPNHTFTGQA